MSDKISIPNKSHFTFDEVATITGVKKYVLRFWETEFDEIDPIVSSAGQKLFEHKDIDAILKIKKLLFEEKHTIEKAKAILQKGELTEDEVNSIDDEAFVPETIVEEAAIEVASKKSKIDSAPLRDKLTTIIELANSLEERHNWR